MQPPSNNFPDSNDPFSNQPMQTPENLTPISSAPSTIPTRGPVISFDVISEAWALFSAGIGVWIGVAFLSMAASTALTFWVLATLPDPSTGRQFSPTFWLALPLFSLIATFFHGGMFRMALGQIRGGRASFGDLWGSINALPALLAVSLIEVLGIGAGSCFCLLPGLLLMSLWIFAAPLIVDPRKKLGVIESLSASFQALKPQMWMALAFALVCYLLAQAGQLACGIGVIVTMPLFYLSITLAYRDFFFSDEAPFSASRAALQPPPIADPHS